MFNYDKLNSAITKSGKTKTYLCQRLGRPAYYLRDIMRQKNKIPLEYQAILADEIGVTVAWLNDQEETPAPKTESERSAKEVCLEKIDELAEKGGNQELLDLLAAITEKLRK